MVDGKVDAQIAVEVKFVSMVDGKVIVQIAEEVKFVSMVDWSDRIKPKKVAIVKMVKKKTKKTFDRISQLLKENARRVDSNSSP